MSGEYFGWAALGLTCLGIFLILRDRAGRKKLARIHCPGEPVGLLGWLNPRRWFWYLNCGYNLTGLPSSGTGAIRCPECGATSACSRHLRKGRGLRVWAVGALCLSCSMAAFATPWIQTSRWPAAIPTVLLVLNERTNFRRSVKPLRLELELRVCSRTVDGVAARALARKLVRDLADDHIKGNAERAADLLPSLWPDSRAALEDGVAHGDRQTRLIAAELLRQRCPSDPSDALLAACIEDLRNDEIRVEFWTSGNARAAAEYLCAFADRAEQPLRGAIASDDWQQRFLAAAVAGFSQATRLLDSAAPILIKELRDDRVSGNAKIAAPALYGFGPAVIPYLESYWDSSDGQQRKIARAIIERVRFPEQPKDQLEYRMPRITDLTDDPLHNLSISDGFCDLP